MIVSPGKLFGGDWWVSSALAALLGQGTTSAVDLGNLMPSMF